MNPHADTRTLPWLAPRAAYIHIPFCAHRCGYCDFAVTAGQDELVEPYLDALALELATLGEPWPVATLFLGGGTPTYLSAAQLDRLFTALNRWLPRHPGAEVSIEATPESLTVEKAAVLARHGVNRVSLGVQSFRPDLLATLERIHGPAEVPTAVAAVQSMNAALSLDLIFGVPGQTPAMWADDVQQALTFAPDHLATYGLTYETGTRLWKQRQRGGLIALDDEAERTMYLHAQTALASAGFEHYEISNFARPGHRCRHNQVYWANEAYHGFGVGAARYVNGTRSLNTRSTRDYIRRVQAGEPTAFQSETLPPLDRAWETLAVQLRRADGIHRAGFHTQTGYELDALAGAELRTQTAAGLLTDDGDAVKLTPAGTCVADALVERLLRLA